MKNDIFISQMFFTCFLLFLGRNIKDEAQKEEINLCYRPEATENTIKCPELVSDDQIFQNSEDLLSAIRSLNNSEIIVYVCSTEKTTENIDFTGTKAKIEFVSVDGIESFLTFSNPSNSSLAFTNVIANMQQPESNIEDVLFENILLNQTKLLTNAHSVECFNLIMTSSSTNVPTFTVKEKIYIAEIPQPENDLVILGEINSALTLFGTTSNVTVTYGSETNIEYDNGKKILISSNEQKYLFKQKTNIYVKTMDLSKTKTQISVEAYNDINYYADTNISIPRVIILLNNASVITKSKYNPVQVVSSYGNCNIIDHSNSNMYMEFLAVKQNSTLIIESLNDNNNCSLHVPNILTGSGGQLISNRTIYATYIENVYTQLACDFAADFSDLENEFYFQCPVALRKSISLVQHTIHFKSLELLPGSSIQLDLTILLNVHKIKEIVIDSDIEFQDKILIKIAQTGDTTHIFEYVDPFIENMDFTIPIIKNSIINNQSFVLATENIQLDTDIISMEISNETLNIIFLYLSSNLAPVICCIPNVESLDKCYYNEIHTAINPEILNLSNYIEKGISSLTIYIPTEMELTFDVSKCPFVPLSIISNSSEFVLTCPSTGINLPAFQISGPLNVVISNAQQDIIPLNCTNIVLNDCQIITNTKFQLISTDILQCEIANIDNFDYHDCPNINIIETRNVSEIIFTDNSWIIDNKEVRFYEANVFQILFNFYYSYGIALTTPISISLQSENVTQYQPFYALGVLNFKFLKNTEKCHTPLIEFLSTPIKVSSESSYIPIVPSTEDSNVVANYFSVESDIPNIVNQFDITNQEYYISSKQNTTFANVNILGNSEIRSRTNNIHCGIVKLLQNSHLTVEKIQIDSTIDGITPKIYLDSNSTLTVNKDTSIFNIIINVNTTNNMNIGHIIFNSDLLNKQVSIHFVSEMKSSDIIQSMNEKWYEILIFNSNISCEFVFLPMITTSDGEINYEIQKDENSYKFKVIDDDNNNGKNNKMIIIIAGSICVVVFLVIIIFVIIVLRRRNKKYLFESSDINSRLI